jgi:hypothetical protein
MSRWKPLIAVAVVACLLGSSIAWAVALWTAPLGAYEVALHLDDGRFAVVLDRRAPAERTSGHGDPAMNDGDGLHDEYVVTLATLDVCSTGDAGKTAKACGLAVGVGQTLRVAHLWTAYSGAATTRTEPPLPASFSILRL